MKRIFDTAACVVALSAGLALSSISLVFCPTAHAGSAAQISPAAVNAPTEASKTAMQLDTDDDGDELLEHWSDPKYSGEERLQLIEILSAFAVAGTVTLVRRRVLRRTPRHG